MDLSIFSSAIFRFYFKASTGYGLTVRQSQCMGTVQSARLCALVYLATLMLWRRMTSPTSSTNMITVTATTATTSPATAAQPAPAASVDDGYGETEGESFSSKDTRSFQLSRRADKHQNPKSALNPIRYLSSSRRHPISPPVSPILIHTGT